MHSEPLVTIARMVVGTQLPIFVCDLQRLEPHLALARTAIDELRVSHPESVASNVRASYMSPWKSQHLNPKLLPLCQSTATIAQSCASLICGSSLADLNLGLEVTDCWGVVYEQADAARRHNHFPADFAAVAYLEAEEGCAPIVFAGHMAVHPKPKTLVVFPGILDHEVPANAGRRTIVAMNLQKRATFLGSPA